MTFRRRMVLLAAGAVAASIVIASVIVYFVTRDELRGQVDESLRQTAASAQVLSGNPAATLLKDEGERARIEREFINAKVSVPTHGFSNAPVAIRGISISGSSSGGGGLALFKGSRLPTLTGPRTVKQTQAIHIGPGHGSASHVVIARPGQTAKLVLPRNAAGALAYAQLIYSGNQVLKSEAHGYLPFAATTRAVASGEQGPSFSDATVDGTHMRILTARATGPEGGHAVLETEVPLTDMDATLAHLRLVLALVCLGGVVLAALLGLLVSRAALVPVRRLTHAAERVTRTQNLGHRITASEQDELGRLATSFNTMLAALERSRLAQRQLVSDASHELRTPLTSIQANLHALGQGERLPAQERTRILAAAQEQLGELGVLVGDLVDLSKTEVDRLELEDIRLDLAVAGALERAHRHAPACRFELAAEPCLVRVAPARLDRAISNLIDNAVKWGPPGGPVEVAVRAGKVIVRDHGPGIDPEDLPRVFERFYRSPAARSRPGSGLGLAIVRQMAESHRGAVHAANHADGGAVLTLELQTLEMTEAERLSLSRTGALQKAPRLLSGGSQVRPF